jgi:hypothetical protein
MAREVRPADRHSWQQAGGLNGKSKAHVAMTWFVNVVIFRVIVILLTWLGVFATFMIFTVPMV